MPSKDTALPTWDALPDGVVWLRTLSSGASLVECGHAAPTSGTGWCPVCKGTARTTSGFLRPVKMLVVIPEGAQREVQAALFA